MFSKSNTQLLRLTKTISPHLRKAVSSLQTRPGNALETNSEHLAGWQASVSAPVARAFCYVGCEKLLDRQRVGLIMSPEVLTGARTSFFCRMRTDRRLEVHAPTLSVQTRSNSSTSHASKRQVGHSEYLRNYGAPERTDHQR